ncbi:elongation of very long chain fatty acids protein 1-like [Sipha flava]|uniref:Elongation of very long chain fatty acids protein n=1 Tax=Sipha flava TaxID=143950 RepID=A0A2S2QKJ6_9HEMI|nr:elongation of very long chain fatty acids protein 1-like [Sipha flava]
MSVLIQNIQNSWGWVERNTDPRIKDLWLMGSIWPITFIVIIYLYFVLKIGPELMRYRNPFNIDRIVLVYNAVQVFLSFYVVKEIFKVLWLQDEYRFFCVEVTKTDDDLAKKQIFLVWMALMIKLLDLLDTIFFVLRKKQNQVTFLHVYHHAMVVTLGWVCCNFFPGGQVAFFGTVNGMVHVVMYSYYFLTLLNPEYKKAWWKKYLTLLQLIQFVVTGIHALISLFEPNCDFPRIILMVAIPQDIFMFILFWDFYKKSYINTNKNKQA